MATATSREPYVFISYASTDRQRVLDIVGILQAHGVPLWLDRRSIIGGQRWTAEIVRGVENCAVLLLMCSPASVASRNVQQEVQLAWESGRPLLPVILDRVQWPPEIRYALAGRQWIEVRDRPQPEWLPEIIAALVSAGIHVTRTTSTKPSDFAAEGGAAGRDPLPSPGGRVHNLPAPRDTFIGRASELAQAEAALAQHRVVTLTGPGGVGKSRLALELAWRSVRTYPDGVWLVSMENASGLASVLQSVADALEFKEPAGLTLLQQLTGRLAGQDALLVLDNCERALDSCVELTSALTDAGRGLRALTTSREILGMRGERVLVVPPMAVPSPDDDLSPSSLRSIESVQLFIDRAAAVSPGFELDSRNAHAIASVCRELDGIPLSIELAAGRMRTLSPEDLALRLSGMFSLLRTADRGAPARQRTLAATVDWSYDTLEEQERALWRRLSVFAGTFTLQSAERVCGFVPLAADEVLDLVTELVDKSLVLAVRGGSQVRYRILRTLRQYAWAKLCDSGEAGSLRDRHAEWCGGVVKTGDFGTVRQEYPEIRAALEYLLDAGDRGKEALDLAGSEIMYRVFYDSYPGDGERLLAAIHRQAPQTKVLSLGWVLCALGRLRQVHGRDDETGDLLNGAQEIGRNAGDQLLVDRSLQGLGIHEVFRGQQEKAVATLTEAIEHARRNGINPRTSLTNLASIYVTAGDFAAARPLLQESLQMGEHTGLAQYLLGLIALLEDDIEEARRYAEQGLAEARSAKAATRIAYNLSLLGLSYLEGGEIDKAAGAARECLTVLTNEGMRLHSGPGLLILAWIAFLRGQSARAATILGASEALGLQVGGRLPAQWTPPELTRRLRTAPEWSTIERAWVAGKDLTIDQATAFAMDDEQLPLA